VVQRSAEIEARTKEFYSGLERGDAEVVNRLFSKQDGVIGIGTDPDEWWEGFDTIAAIWRAQLSELGAIKVEGADPRGFASGDVGWVADRPTFVVGGETRIPFRITAVFERENADWQLAQFHASIGAANEEAVGQELTTQIGQQS
jgi:hypothetical protein